MININKIYSILSKEVVKYNVPIIELIELETKDPFKILIGTILSARTKDQVTIKASRKLFSKVNKVDDFKKLEIKEIEKLIYPIGFFHNKAKFLKELPNHIKNNIIPDTIEELIKLPGVGRKTANLVLAVAFKKEAICVDTHVHRIMNRIGYVKTKTPFKTEMELRKILPKKYWIKINYLLVSLGQNLCRPISPFCSKCKIKKYCKKIGVKKQR